VTQRRLGNRFGSRFTVICAAIVQHFVFLYLNQSVTLLRIKHIR